VQADLPLDDVNAETYDALVLPGGRAPEYLRNRSKAVEIVRHFLESNKPIAANCHGPLLIRAAGSVRGKTMTCYPELEPDIRAAGAEFVNRDVVVDGSMVTVRGWPDNGPWMREFVRVLKERKPGKSR
jgi:protease I